jgi:hypothetical protein
MTRESLDVEKQTNLDDAQVEQFLREHPKFFNKYPALLSQLELPGRELGAGVEDLQVVMLERLRAENTRAKSQQRELITTGRSNLSTQTRIHECVLALLDANSFEQLVQIVTTDFAVLLEMDIVVLCIEADDTEVAPIRTRGLQIIQPGLVDELIGSNREVILRSNVEGDPDIFGGGATLVQSDALARVIISKSTPNCMLAFGSRNSKKFHPGQATDLLGFLASVTQNVIRLWLQLPG